MDTHQTVERDEFESRVCAVEHLVSDKLGVRSDGDSTSNGGAAQRSSEEPFPFVWDFNKPWRNK